MLKFRKSIHRLGPGRSRDPLLSTREKDLISRSFNFRLKGNRFSNTMIEDDLPMSVAGAGRIDLVVPNVVRAATPAVTLKQNMKPII